MHMPQILSELMDGDPPLYLTSRFSRLLSLSCCLVGNTS